MARRFNVWYTKDNETLRTTSWFVSDITPEEHKSETEIKDDRSIREKFRFAQQEEIRPRAATFPVSPLYDSDTQERRATMLADYLNKIEDARRHAESQTTLVDLLSAQAPTLPPA